METATLILSRKDNVHADAVADNLTKKGSVIRRVNFDLEKSEKKNFPLVNFGKENQHFDSIFIHHPRVSYNPAWFIDDLERKLFVASWSSVPEWAESQFNEGLWINKPSANQKSKNVLGQVKLATSVGFQTPDTLFTNNIEELRAFAGKDTIVIKQGNLGVHMEKQRILTSVVNIASVDADMLTSCPCLFQKYVHKAFELRIHVINDTVLTCKIDSQSNEKTRIDWRDYDIPNTPHSIFDIDDTTRKKCISLLKNMGLSFGVIDAIITPEDDLVFLECNAQGHWLWIEELTHLPITETLCEYLFSGRG